MWVTPPRFSMPDDDGGGSGGDRRRPSGERDAFGFRRSDEEEPLLGSGGDRGRPWPLPGRRIMASWLLGERGIGGERGPPRRSKPCMAIGGERRRGGGDSGGDLRRRERLRECGERERP